MLRNPQPQGVLGNKYGYRKPFETPNGKTNPWHSGQDIRTGGRPSPVFAPGDGTVVATGINGVRKGAPLYPSGAGNYIVLYFPTSAIGRRIWVVLAHLSSVSVAVGQTVHSGQQIGISGTTGLSTGVHLHIGITTTPSSAVSAHIDPTRVMDFSKDPRDSLSGKPEPTKPVQEDDMNKTLLYRNTKSGETVIANVVEGLLFHIQDTGMRTHILTIPDLLDDRDTRDLGPIAFQALCAIIIEGKDPAKKQAIFNRAISTPKS